MEQIGAICEGDWISLSGMYNSNEEADFMAQLLGGGDEVDQNNYLSFDFVNYASSSQEISMYLSDFDANCITSSYLVDENQEIEEKVIDPFENVKKRARVCGDVKRNVKSKKKNQEEDNNNNNGGGGGRATSSSCCSEDESNGVGETSSLNSKGKKALNLNGKTRATRGSATDPQSLYARKRRERINERLRILQSLVPNGTKVDISTMLEEAVQYVKFLQLQIKLLSSDELWMYAPIAYNGMNIGLDHIKVAATAPAPKSS